MDTQSLPSGQYSLNISLYLPSHKRNILKQRSELVTTTGYGLVLQIVQKPHVTLKHWWQVMDKIFHVFMIYSSWANVKILSITLVSALCLSDSILHHAVILIKNENKIYHFQQTKYVHVLTFLVKKKNTAEILLKVAFLLVLHT